MAGTKKTNRRGADQEPGQQPAQPARGRVSRRRMLGQMAAGLAGAGLALPLAAEATAAPARNQPPAPASEAASTPPAATGWQPRFLDRHQVATLVALGERIAPGAAQAKAHEFIDLLLGVLPADAEQDFRTGNSVPVGTVSVGPRARQRLLDALGAFDGQARRRYGRPFQQLSAAQQDAMLTAAEQAAEDHPAHRHYLAARNWVLGAYYSTEAGIRELGWTGQLFFSRYPNCAAV
ncbi:MAG: gluconate 2-dehydrogenase subunit 3 family protein [Terriglobales bacterium]